MIFSKARKLEKRTDSRRYINDLAERCKMEALMLFDT